MKMQVCICGAGTMGSGIAQVCAQSGFDTKLFDVNADALEAAKMRITKNLDYLVGKNKIDQNEKNDILNRIQFISEIKDCTAFVIIEAIVEKLDAKVSLFNELALYNNEEVVFASNTSSISISEMQKVIVAPGRVVGMHFFNPPYIMPLVEVIEGAQTDSGIVNAVIDLCNRMGKQPALCKDSPGFIVNRVARQYYLESLLLAENEVATVEEIDRILKATGFKMGPFELMDMIGMDINLATTESLYNAFDHAERFKPSSLQLEKVNAGKLGKKTGEGFYKYTGNK